MLPKKMVAPQDMQDGATFKTKRHGLVRVIEYYNTHTVIVFLKILAMFELLAQQS